MVLLLSRNRQLLHRFERLGMAESPAAMLP